MKEGDTEKCKIKIIQECLPNSIYLMLEKTGFSSKIDHQSGTLNRQIIIKD